MYLRRALTVGALGYVLKSGVIEELLVALTEVQSGNIYVSAGLGRDVLAGRLNLSGTPTREEGKL
jgi:DNA-binding NarL/FixJ family response regulator